jgi:hypothetical protein
MYMAIRTEKLAVSTSPANVDTNRKKKNIDSTVT